MTINGAPGSLIWFWVGATTFNAPSCFDGNEYDYVLFLNLDDPVATEGRSWSSLKSLFR
jgi:hypothetical protein